MGKYIVRRLLQMIPVFFGATLLIFCHGLRDGRPHRGPVRRPAVRPGDIAASSARSSASTSRCWQQYVMYMGNCLHGDFGTAFNGQVVTELAVRFPVTIRLTIVAIVFEIVIGITAGVVTGLRRGRPVDTWCWSSPWSSSPSRPSSPAAAPAAASASGWGDHPGRPPRRAPSTSCSCPDFVLGSRLPGLRHPADPDLHRREPPLRLRPHRRGQGPAPAPWWASTPAAQLADPGGHLHRHRHRRPDGRRDRHRAHLQHPRRRLPALPGHPAQNAQTVVGLVTVLVLVFLVANLIVDLLYGVLDPRIRYA